MMYINQRDLLANYTHKRHFFQTAHADLNRNFLYMKNHKAACSTVIGSLYSHIARSNDQVFEVQTLDELHKSRHGLIEKSQKFGVPKLVQALGNPDIFKFTFIRDPLSRILSAYADKIATGDKQRMSLLSKLGETIDRDISLQEFIRILHEVSIALDVDRHWREQVKEISFFQIHYDFIGCVETLDQDLTKVLSQIFPDDAPSIYDSRKLLSHSTSSMSLAKELSKADHALIRKIYSDDFEMYDNISKKLKRASSSKTSAQALSPKLKWAPSLIPVPDKLPTIAALWIEGDLSYMEQLCLKSFVDVGHEVILYRYGDVGRVPKGVAVADGRDVLTDNRMIVHEKTGSPAPHADHFRYKLLQKNPGIIWADTDAYCVHPFRTLNGHFHGWESRHLANIGVLGLPADSTALEQLLEFCEEDYPIPPWYEPKKKSELQQLHDAGIPPHVSTFEWGLWGPRAFTHFLKVTGEIQFSMPVEALYPVAFRDRRELVKRPEVTADRITSNTYSVHFYGRRMRKFLVEKHNGIPPAHTYLAKLLKKHGIKPEKAPIPYKPKTNTK